MTEIFTTNIPGTAEAKPALKAIKNSFPDLEISFDEGSSSSPYPCGHSILRVEGHRVDPEGIISLLNTSGFRCDVLEDKICR